MSTPPSNPRAEYDFELPPELIAQQPAQRRADARLLLVARGEGVRGEAVCRDLPSLLRPGDLLVINDSRVLPARLAAQRAGGGKVELLLVAPRGGGAWRALARPARRLRRGDRLQLRPGPGSRAEARAAAAPQASPILSVLELAGDGFVDLIAEDGDLAAVAEDWGGVPLPPYIRRAGANGGGGGAAAAALRRRDRERYQTVYARVSGSVAAPTAGLHFDAELLGELQARGVGLASVTLHVGPGTFRPPSAADVARRRLHPEAFHFPAAVDAALRRTGEAGGRVIAVGTTALRVLETVRRLGLEAAGPARRVWDAAPAEPDPIFTGAALRRAEGWEVEGSTRLFLLPPDVITAADGLLTNFHLPGSSLLMLVAAAAGRSAWRAAYAHAVAARFRFYSYGDAMLLLPPGNGAGDAAGGGRGDG